MNILFLAHRIPYPPNKGDKIRSFNELKYLSGFSNIYLAALVDDPRDKQYESKLHEQCCETHFVLTSPKIKRIISFIGLLTNQSLSVRYFHNSILQCKIDKLFNTQNFDAVFCFSSTMAEYVYKSKTFQKIQTSQRPKLIMDFCDMDSMKWLEYAQKSSWPLSLIYNREWKKLSAYETKIATDFNVSLFVSRREQALFEKHNPGCKNIKTMSNGVDLNFFSPNNTCDNDKEPSQPELVFTGAMDYQANIDGVLWFYEQIWPIIVKAHPTTTFSIVGSNPVPVIQKLAQHSNITVTGFVEDIRPYYQGATICIAPLRVARGIQNKVLEAMAMAKPVVCTSNAAEGIIENSGHGIFCQDTPDYFAKIIITLINNKAKRQQTSIKNRQYVEKHFDWNKNLSLLKELTTN